MKPLTDEEIQRLTAMVVAGGVGASEAKRLKFMRSARRLALRLAHELQMPKGAFRIVLEPGSLGRSGEVTLKARELELLLSADMVVGGHPRIYYRRARGGVINAALGNHWLNWSEFGDFARAVAKIASPSSVPT